MKEVKIILISIAIILFFSNYWICDYFYYNDEVKDLKSWWSLKTKLYAVIIGLTLLATSFNATKWLKFVCEIGVGLAISNIIDKVFFNVLTFTKSDFIMITTTLIFSTYNLINGHKQRAIK